MKTTKRECPHCRGSLERYEDPKAIVIIGELQAELNEATTQLRAWQESFGTSQLTHALARLEAAEKRDHAA
jgi:hypothetical protein